MPTRPSFEDTAHRRAFGATVARLRASKGWTQEDLAEHARLHRSYLAAVEVGSRNPTLDVIVKIASALGVSPSALFD